MKQRTKVGPVDWEEFKAQAFMRYCPQHYEMNKKMEFYKFEQQQENEVGLSVHEYKEKFLHLHKYAPEMEGR